MKNLFKYVVVYLFILSLNFAACWGGDSQERQKQEASYNDFDSNPFTSKKYKKKLKPYLLPLSHPIKERLDAIFLTTRATLNVETLATAGFLNLFTQPRSFIRVVKHPNISNYLFKIYLDSELRIKRKTAGWKWFFNRVKNAKRIGRLIKEHHLKYFTVPKKWIYPLPIYPYPPNNFNYLRKNEVLVVEEMDLVSQEQNLVAWRTVITKRHLNELYFILIQAGGSSYRPDNIAYTKKGKFAFIDTEYRNKDPDLRSIIPYLSSEMAMYWKRLTGI